MSDLDDMALFAAVVNANSFSGASERTGVPVATLSRRVRALEGRLGVSLLKRTTRSMQLTEAGQVYLRYCESVVAQEVQARNALLDMQEEPVGHLVLAGSFSSDDDWGGRLVADFLQRYSGIRLTAIFLGKDYDLDALEFDLAFAHGDKPQTRHLIQSLGDNPMVLCASPSYLARKGIPERIDDLDAHEMIYCDLFGTFREMPEQLRKYFASARIVCSDVVGARQLALNGAGIVWMPEVVVSSLLVNGALLRVVPECSSVLPGWLVMSNTAVGTRKVDAFLRHFMTAAIASAPWRFPK